MSRIILLNANNIFNFRVYNNDPLNGLIAGILQQHNHIVNCLYSMNWNQIFELVLNQYPDFIGINIKLPTSLNDLKHFFNLLKSINDDVKIIAYGEYITTSHSYLIKENMDLLIDYFIIGEAELSFVEIVENDLKKNEKIIFGKKLKKLENYPWVVSNSENEINIRASRGCKFNCLFCEEKHIYKEYCLRSAEDVVEEIRTFFNRTTTEDRWIYFSDLDFLSVNSSDSTWINRFVELCLKEKLKFRFAIQTRVDRMDMKLLGELKKIGLSNVALGVETNSERIAKFYRKGISSLKKNIEAVEMLQKLHIPCKINFIMFEPTTTLYDLKKNLEFFNTIRFPKGMALEHPPVTFYNKLKIYPNSEMYFYYKNRFPQIEMTLEDGFVKYKFLHKEIQEVYERVKLWRKMAKEFLLLFYGVLNSVIKCEISSQLILKLSYLQREFMSLDIKYFDDSISLFPFEKYKCYEDKLNTLKNQLQRIINQNTNIDTSIDNMDFRIWHGQLARLYDIEET